MFFLFFNFNCFSFQRKDNNFEFPYGLAELDDKTKKSEDDVEEVEQIFHNSVRTQKQSGRTGLPSFFSL